MDGMGRGCKGVNLTWEQVKATGREEERRDGMGGGG